MRLVLVKRANGDVTLRARHSIGEDHPFETSILTFKTNGRIVRHQGVAHRAGFKLNELGEVRING